MVINCLITDTPEKIKFIRELKFIYLSEYVMFSNDNGNKHRFIMNKQKTN